jgi:hypothetical protein
VTAEGTPIDLEKLRSIGVISRRTGNQVREGRDNFGNRFKAVTDELGNTVTQRAGDRQDVTIRAPKLAVTATAKEEPHERR